MDTHAQLLGQCPVDPRIRCKQRQIDGMPGHSAVTRYVGKVSFLVFERVLDPGSAFERIFQLLVCGFVYSHGDVEYIAQKSGMSTLNYDIKVRAFLKVRF